MIGRLYFAEAVVSRCGTISAVALSGVATERCVPRRDTTAVLRICRLLQGADEEEEEAQEDQEEVDDLALEILLVEEQGTA